MLHMHLTVHCRNLFLLRILLAQNDLLVMIVCYFHHDKYLHYLQYLQYLQYIQNVYNVLYANIVYILIFFR